MIEPTPFPSLAPAAATFFTAPLEPAFWRPRYLADSSALQHLPLLFWMTHALRPSNVAVLGIGDGVALFALCQVMDKLDRTGSCTGFGFGDEPVTERLRDHARLLYDDLLTWRHETSVSQALASLPENGVDLMIVNADDLPETTSSAPRDWTRPLAPNGVIVVLGKLPQNSGQAVPLSGLTSEAACFRVAGEPELQVIATGRDHPQRFRQLLDGTGRGALSPAIALFFRRIGRALQAEAASERPASLAAMEAQVIALQADLNDREQQIAALNEQAEMAAAEYAQNLAAALADRDHEISALQEETATLSRQLESIQRSAQTAQIRLADENQALRQERDTLARRIDELLASTSWRITAPIRWIRHRPGRD